MLRNNNNRIRMLSVLIVVLVSVSLPVMLWVAIPGAIREWGCPSRTYLGRRSYRQDAGTAR